MKLPEIECPRHPDGRLATQADSDLVTEKLNGQPSALTPFDVAVTRYFHGDPGAQLVEGAMKSAQSQQRRAAMRTSEHPPAPLPSSRATTTKSLAMETFETLGVLRVQKSRQKFDRREFEKEARANYDGTSPVRGGYDAVKFLTAGAVMDHCPEELTDDDLDQLQIVDPALAKKARAAREKARATPHDEDAIIDEAYQRTQDPSQVALANIPVSFLLLTEYVSDALTGVKHWLSTVQYKARLANDRLDQLESRSAELTPAAKAARPSDSMRFCGAWREGMAVEPGDLVTHDESSYIARKSVQVSPNPSWDQRHGGFTWMWNGGAAPSMLRFPGEWSKGRTYERANVVIYNNQLFIAKQYDSSGSMPGAANDQVWQALMSTTAAAPPDSTYIKSLEARIAELERRPSLAYEGVYQPDHEYAAGAVISHDGSAWVALSKTSAKPGTQDAASRSWRLLVKKGRDAKDAR